MVGRELDNLEDSSADEGSYEVVRDIEAKRGVDYLKFTPGSPFSADLYPTVGQGVPDVGEGEIRSQGSIDHSEGNEARSYYQKYLNSINIDQSFDASRHSVDCRNHSQNDDGIHQELELDRAVEDD